MRRAVDSVILNIAEGSSKDSVADMCAYLRHALGGVKELEVQIEKVSRLGYLEGENVRKLLEELEIIGKMINGFIRKLRERG